MTSHDNEFAMANSNTSPCWSSDYSTWYVAGLAGDAVGGE